MDDKRDSKESMLSVGLDANDADDVNIHFDCIMFQ